MYGQPNSLVSRAKAREECAVTSMMDDEDSRRIRQRSQYRYAGYRILRGPATRITDHTGAYIRTEELFWDAAWIKAGHFYQSRSA